ncbi:MAG: hypothetical protein NT178_15300 [Proteobacteria bacterium]|nr:hypothetical protein [Pseudomonadota bacterium]
MGSMVEVYNTFCNEIYDVFGGHYQHPLLIEQDVDCFIKILMIFSKSFNILKKHADPDVLTTVEVVMQSPVVIGCGIKYYITANE